MKNVRTALALLVGLCLGMGDVSGQYFATDKWMEYLEEVETETEDSERMESLHADLSHLAEHPFNMNEVTAEDLRRLPFLSDRQIGELLAYRQYVKRFFSLYELKNLTSFDVHTVELLLPFVFIGETIVDNRPFTVDNLLKYGRKELQIKYEQCFQQKKGYRPQPDSLLASNPNKRYLGEPFYHSVSYSYSFANHLDAGFTAEKDAGEPFLKTRHQGYDHYSVHCFLTHFGRLKILALGDYKVSFGQGLVISHDFTLSRNNLVTQVERRTSGFRRHFSTNEQDYFRGAAVTFSHRKMDYSLFYSYRSMDAAIDTSANTFASIKTDGLHRLERDWDKRHTLPLHTLGANVSYLTPNFSIGMTALGYSFGRYTMLPELHPYNRFFFRGNHNANASLDYLYRRHTFTFYGETALSANVAVATLNALQITPADYITFLLLHRYYAPAYQALYASAFSQNSAINNESGFYTAIQLEPIPYWTLSAYADVFRFPWLRYNVDAPSNGKEYMTQVGYTCSSDERITACIRYRYRQLEKNHNDPTHPTVAILPYTIHRLRLQCTCPATATLALRSTADVVLNTAIDATTTHGFMLAQNITWQPTATLQGDLYTAFFRTDGYDTRITTREKYFPYTYRSNNCYGTGIRLALLLRWQPSRRLTIYAKITHTHHADRDILGTDLEEIAHPFRTDFSLCLRHKL